MTAVLRRELITISGSQSRLKRSSNNRVISGALQELDNNWELSPKQTTQQNMTENRWPACGQIIIFRSCLYELKWFLWKRLSCIEITPFQGYQYSNSDTLTRGSFSGPSEYMHYAATCLIVHKARLELITVHYIIYSTIGWQTIGLLFRYQQLDLTPRCTASHV